MSFSKKQIFTIVINSIRNKKIFRILSLQLETFLDNTKRKKVDQYSSFCWNIEDLLLHFFPNIHTNDDVFGKLEDHINDFKKKVEAKPYPSKDNPYPLIFGLDQHICRFLYYFFIMTKPNIVIETGVANGFSSSYILLALEQLENSKLISIDDTFLPFHTKEKIGGAIPIMLRKKHSLVIGNSLQELKKILKSETVIDCFFHDSFHTYRTMTNEFQLVWPHIRNGGFLLSDDVSLNDAFLDFADRVKRKPITIQKKNGYFGILQK